MNCDFTERVSLLVDGELAPTEAHAVERHLLTCVECRQARADFLSLRRELTAYPVAFDALAQRRALAAVLSGQRSNARGATADARGWRERLAGVFGVPRLSPALAGTLALLVVACAVAFVVYRNARRTAPLVAVAPVSQQHEPIGAAPNVSPAPNTNNSTGGVHSGRTNNEVAGNVGPQRIVPRSGQPLKARSESASVKPPRTRRVQPERLPRPANELAPDYTTASADAMDAARPTRSADAETLTARHVEQAELLLRTFRNARADDAGAAGLDLRYEKARAQQLLYQNIVLRREAVAAGNVQVAGLLDSLEPILLDIANLNARPQAEDVRAIKGRVQRKNLVALLQVNSVALARAYD